MADQEARDELRRLLDSAAGRLLDAGLSWDEVVVVLRKRLGPAEPPVAPLPRSAVGLPDDGRPYWPKPGGGWTTEPPEGLSRRRFDPIPSPAEWPLGPITVQTPDGEIVEGVNLRAVPPPMALATEVMTPEPDRPFPSAEGEPPVGSVVTDTRLRVCWRDEAGWHRSDGTDGGAERVLTWHDIVQAVGGPKRTAQPGTPSVVSTPPKRSGRFLERRPAGTMELQVQRAVLGPDGEPLLGPDGRKLLRADTETTEITEIVPVGGQP